MLYNRFSVTNRLRLLALAVATVIGPGAALCQTTIYGIGFGVPFGIGLYSISPSTGAATAIAPISPSYLYVAGIDFSPQGVLYGSAVDLTHTRDLITINKSTGTATQCPSTC